jgi:hypothetical protein
MPHIANEEAAQRYNVLLEEFNGHEELALRQFTKWRALHDHFWLGWELLGLKNIKRVGGRHRIDPPFHNWLVDSFDAEPDTDRMVLVPRDHLKSMWAKVYAIAYVLANPNQARVLLISVSSRRAKGNLRAIRQLFSLPAMLETFQEEIPEPGESWNNWEKSTEALLTTTRLQEVYDQAPPDNAQIEAIGLGGKITGSHYDLIIWDDIINEDSVKNGDQILYVEEKCAMLDQVKDPHGAHLIIGTPYHYADIYSKMREVISAEHVQVRGCWEGGQPIYSFYTNRMLELKKTKLHIMYGSNYMFSCQYECNPEPTDMRVFPKPHPKVSKIPSEVTNFIAVDPAYTTKDHSDFTAIVLGAREKNTNRLFIRQAEAHKVTLDKIARVLLDMWLEHQVQRIGIEGMFHEQFAYIWEQVKAQWQIEKGVRFGGEIIVITPKRTLSKADRINFTMGAFCRNRQFFVHEDCRALLAEMDHFPSNQSGDDLVDAASMLIQISGLAMVESSAYESSAESRTLNKVWTWESLVKGENDRDAKYDWERQFARTATG